MWSSIILTILLNKKQKRVYDNFLPGDSYSRHFYMQYNVPGVLRQVNRVQRGFPRRQAKMAEAPEPALVLCDDCRKFTESTRVSLNGT